MKQEAEVKAGFSEGFPPPLLQGVEEKTPTSHENDFPAQNSSHKRYKDKKSKKNDPLDNVYTDLASRKRLFSTISIFFLGDLFLGAGDSIHPNFGNRFGI